jgi:hypothetical protein
MANKDAAFGFRPVRHLSGGLIRRNEYTIAANYGTDIFHGQCVKAVTAGGIEAAAAGNVILGVFGGCFFTDPTTSKPTFSNNYPASTNASDIVAFVYDDPRIVFEVQELDTSTAGTSGQFKQIGISKDPDNSDTSSANVNVYVIPNTAEHSYLLTTALS